MKINAIPCKQTTTSRDNFREKLDCLKNVLNFGNIACAIKGDIENIFICFPFRRKETVKGNKYMLKDMFQDMLEIGGNYSILNHKRKQLKNLFRIPR